MALFRGLDRVVADRGRFPVAQLGGWHGRPVFPDVWA